MATLAAILDWLAETGSAKGIADMARYGIPGDGAFGVPMGRLQAHAKSIGKDHDLALALWDHGAYEAQTLAVFLADPQRLTAEQADNWVRDFTNWAICDTACFHLLDRTPYRWAKPALWAASDHEFTRRAAFALIWALSVHDKTAPDADFTATFPLMQAAATDPRPLVGKAIDMALRATGKRNPALNAAAIRFTQTLLESPDKPSCWIGNHALRELQSPAVQARLKP